MFVWLMFFFRGGLEGGGNVSVFEPDVVHRMLFFSRSLSRWECSIAVCKGGSVNTNRAQGLDIEFVFGL